jgi:hypothetical protein
MPGVRPQGGGTSGGTSTGGTSGGTTGDDTDKFYCPTDCNGIPLPDSALCWDAEGDRTCGNYRARCPGGCN